jgi:hypothetical protein
MTDGVLNLYEHIANAPNPDENKVDPEGGSRQVSEALKDKAAQAANAQLLAGLPEEIRDHQSLKSVKGVEDLATQFVNQQSMIGNSLRIPTKDTSEEATAAFYKKLMDVPGVVRLPGEDADEAVWSEFNAKVGVPATADEYSIQLPEGTTLEPEFLQEATTTAHALSLNNKQLNAILKTEIESRAAAAEAHENYVIESKQALKSVWSDDYDNRIAGASQAYRLYKQDFPEYAAELESVKDNPIFVKLLSDIAGAMQEAGHAGIQAASNYGMSVEDAKIKRAEIQNNKNHDYFKGDEEAVNYMLKLNQIIAGASSK